MGIAPLEKTERHTMSHLITREEYKTEAGISSPNQDALIDQLIPQVSDLVRNICRRTFNSYVDEAKTEVFSGGAFFPLQEFPVIQIQSVETSEDYGKTYSALTEYTDWVLDQENNVIVPVETTAGFQKKINGYRVTYTAGYESIPLDLKLAVMDLLTYYMRNDSAIHSHKNPGSNNVQIEYISTTNLPASIKRVLDLYMANYN